ncbi:hypothetical protein GF340_02455 [Candidatus Peregrinibacteria bacterium]|nr:hypothetical protein [Candidatus Peregrinibacteria bacterium]
MANTSMDLGRKFIGGFVDVKVNGLTPKEGFQQIKDELLNNLPNLGSGNNPTIEQIQLASGVASDAYQLAQQEILYLSEYQALYGETSDVFTKQIVENLIDLKTVIDSSFKYENQTIDCIRSVNAKQC